MPSQQSGMVNRQSKSGPDTAQHRKNTHASRSLRAAQSQQHTLSAPRLTLRRPMWAHPTPARATSLARQHGALVGGRVGAVARAEHLPRLHRLGGRAAEQALLALRQPLAGLRARLEAEYLRGARRAVRRVRCGRPRTGARRGARAAVRAGRAPGSSHTYAQPVRRPGIWRKPAPSCLGQQRAGFQGRLCGRTHTRKDLAQQHA